MGLSIANSHSHTLCRQGKNKESGQQMATKERTQNKFLKLKIKSKIKTINISDPKLDKGFSYMTPISHEHKHTHTKKTKNN